MIIIVYIIALFFILLGLGILKNWQVKSPIQSSFSILIACRNEEKNLPQLFAKLKKMNYPENKFEMIIVDDASTDNSAKLITEFCRLHTNAASILLPEKSTEYKGKKAALKAAAQQAKYEFLLFTDADCLPAEEWINNFNHYISAEIGMIVGSYFEENIDRFQIFCNQASSAIYACTIGLGFPFSGAGGNLCVRRKTFEEVEGYESIKHNVSGDDKQMVTMIAKTRWKIVYNANQDIATVTEKKFREHRNQRRYGKLDLSSNLYKIVSLIVFIFYLYLPYLLITGNWQLFLIYYISVLFFWSCNLVLHKFKFHLSDLLHIIVYPYILIYYSIVGLREKWEWKT